MDATIYQKKDIRTNPDYRHMSLTSFNVFLSQQTDPNYTFWKNKFDFMQSNFKFCPPNYKIGPNGYPTYKKYTNCDHCGDIWDCPTCSTNINHIRAYERETRYVVPDVIHLIKQIF